MPLACLWTCLDVTQQPGYATSILYVIWVWPIARDQYNLPFCGWYVDLKNSSRSGVVQPPCCMQNGAELRRTWEISALWGERELL